MVMPCRSLIFFTLACALPPGIQSALYGAEMANSDFEIAVQPPTENPLEVADNLDALKKAQFIASKMQDRSFSEEQSNLEKAERYQIDAMVSELLRPVRKRLRS